MTSHPILFSPAMAAAILAGTKTQTRRTCKATTQSAADIIGAAIMDDMLSGDTGAQEGIAWRKHIKSPYGKPGDQLWIRETYYQRGHWQPIEGARTKGDRQKWAFIPADDTILFDAPESYRGGRHHYTSATIAWHKRLARFMPRKHSRITLEITSIRVERLQQITEEDAIAEGVKCYHGPLDQNTHSSDFPKKRFWETQKPAPNHWTEFASTAYMSLWESINGPGSWAENPYVWVITFKTLPS